MSATETYFVRLHPQMMEHQSFTHEAKDGTFRAWDVTVGNAIVRDGRETEVFSLINNEVTREKIETLYSTLDWEYSKTTDLTKPLLATLFQGEVLLLDGWHRLARACLEGVPELPVYLLTEEEAERILWLCIPPSHLVSSTK